MNTEQNYVGKGTLSTAPPETAQKQAKSRYFSDSRQPLSYQLKKSLLANLPLSDYEYDWGTVVIVNGQQMAPRIVDGAWVACTLLDPAEYRESTGKTVALLPAEAHTNSETDPHIVGRLHAVNNRYAYLTFDNPAFPAQRIGRKQIGQLFVAHHLVHAPL